jgi:hypothetical protein
MRILKRLPLVLAALLVSVLLAAPAQAQMDKMITTTRTAALGQVRAELSYQETTFANPLADTRLYQPRLKVIREGLTVLDEALPGVGPEGVRQIDGPEVRPLKGAQEPEILLKIGEMDQPPGALLAYRHDPATKRYAASRQEDTGKVEVANKVEIRRVARAKNLQAELIFPQDIMVTGQVNLKITRDGKTFPEIVALAEGEDIAAVDGPALISLAKQREPAVVLNVGSQGAHCCSSTFIYHYVPARRTYALLKHCWGNYRNLATLKDLDQDGVPEFVSRDEDFSGDFWAYVMSGAAPLQIWRYSKGKLEDVTRRYPALIRQDAQHWWQKYQKKGSDWYHRPQPLAAYLADMYLLGKGQQGWQQVRQASLSPSSFSGTFDEVLNRDVKDRQEFFALLRRQLKKHGYAK